MSKTRLGLVISSASSNQGGSKYVTRWCSYLALPRVFGLRNHSILDDVLHHESFFNNLFGLKIYSLRHQLVPHGVICHFYEEFVGSWRLPCGKRYRGWLEHTCDANQTLRLGSVFGSNDYKLVDPAN